MLKPETSVRVVGIQLLWPLSISCFLGCSLARSWNQKQSPGTCDKGTHTSKVVSKLLCQKPAAKDLFERQNWRDLPSPCSFPRWLQYMELGQVEARRWALHSDLPHGWQGHLFTTSQKHQRAGPLSAAAETGARGRVGCRQQLNLLHRPALQFLIQDTRSPGKGVYRSKEGGTRKGLTESCKLQGLVIRDLGRISKGG